jgi:hypothetical protein
VDIFTGCASFETAGNHRAEEVSTPPSPTSSRIPGTRRNAALSPRLIVSVPTNTALAFSPSAHHIGDEKFLEDHRIHGVDDRAGVLIRAGHRRVIVPVVITVTRPPPAA